MKLNAPWLQEEPKLEARDTFELQGSSVSTDPTAYVASKTVKSVVTRNESISRLEESVAQTKYQPREIDTRRKQTGSRH